MLSSSSAAFRPVRQDGGEPRKFWLFGSIAANLLLVGVIGGWMLAMPTDEGKIWRRDLVANLDPADAAVMRDYIAQIDTSRDQAHLAAMDHNMRLMKVLRAESFDKDAFRALMNEMTAIRDKQESETHVIFEAEIAGLSVEGRRRVANALEKYGPGGSREKR